MYTDPGSGLFFLQIIAAAFLTLLYRFRKSLLARLRGTQGSQNLDLNLEK